MELTCNPSRFDVMLTTSIFGDILSDEAGVATGSVGMLASAAINEVLHLGYRTPDIYLEGRGLTKVTTEEMGRLTAEHIHR